MWLHYAFIIAQSNRSINGFKCIINVGLRSLEIAILFDLDRRMDLLAHVMMLEHCTYLKELSS